MPNRDPKLDNLKPFTKKNAAEKGRKGGKARTAAKKRTARRNGRKKCNSRCDDWAVCYFQPMSESKYKGNCALKAIKKEDPERYQRAMDIMTGGEEGWNRQLSKMTQSLMDGMPENDRKDHRETVKTAKEVKESIHGKRVVKKTDLTVEGHLGIDVASVIRIMKEEGENT